MPLPLQIYFILEKTIAIHIVRMCVRFAQTRIQHRKNNEEAMRRVGPAHLNRVREVLEREIVVGQLLPGTPLDEPTLARRFGVSRTPVREALHQLAAVGLIEMRRARSPVVAAFTHQDLLDAFEVMAQLEALCGRLAARRATPADREALERAYADADQAARAGDIDEYYRCDVAVHDALYRAAHNGLLEEQLRTLRNRFGPYRRRHFAWRGRIDQSHEEHARIVAAIEAGDPEEAETVTRAHVSMNGEVLSDFLCSLGEWQQVKSASR